MASPDAYKLTFLRGSGFLLSLVGVWDLMAEASSPWPAQKGFLIVEETKIVVVIERNMHIRRGFEGTYSVEDDQIILTELDVDTAQEQGALSAIEFEIAGDILTLKGLSMPQTPDTLPHVDTFRRRVQPADSAILTEGAIYESWERERNG